MFACIKVLLEIDQTYLKVTVFEDVLNYLLGCRMGGILQNTNDGTEALKTKLQGLTDRKIGLKVKVQKSNAEWERKAAIFRQQLACLSLFQYTKIFIKS